MRSAQIPPTPASSQALDLFLDAAKKLVILHCYTPPDSRLILALLRQVIEPAGIMPQQMGSPPLYDAGPNTIDTPCPLHDNYRDSRLIC